MKLRDETASIEERAVHGSTMTVIGYHSGAVDDEHFESIKELLKRQTGIFPLQPGAGPGGLAQHQHALRTPDGELAPEYRDDSEEEGPQTPLQPPSRI